LINIAIFQRFLTGYRGSLTKHNPNEIHAIESMSREQSSSQKSSWLGLAFGFLFILNFFFQKNCLTSPTYNLKRGPFYFLIAVIGFPF